MLMNNPLSFENERAKKKNQPGPQMNYWPTVDPLPDKIKLRIALKELKEH